MSDVARRNIFDRLQAAFADFPEVERPAAAAPAGPEDVDLVALFQEKMAAVRTEIHRVKKSDWLQTLARITARKKVASLLYGPGTWLAAELEGAWPGSADKAPQLRAYEGEVESFKKELFEMHAGITTTRGAIADTGALILWPTVQEPRLISLVPPIHIAVLDAENIYRSFAEVMARQQWSRGMPTNALLVSGPSKTADIEFTLVYGVHGPEELVVILRDG